MASSRICFRADDSLHRYIQRGATLEREALGAFCRTASAARAGFTIARREPAMLDRWMRLYGESILLRELVQDFADQSEA